MKKISFFVFSLLFCFTNYGAFSQTLNKSQIDSLVHKSMETFKVPGMAVAVLKDGKTIVKKGYGVSSIDTQQPVDTETLFGIASNSKAFTTAALAQLIDQGKIEWDTKVTDIIPEFKLYDAYVTAEFTIRDLLTHRSGLGLGAGDLMLWPTSNTTTKDEIIHNLRYLKPVSSFRSKYDYDNLLYIVAGEIIARVSEQTYDNYLDEHIFKPLNMNRSLIGLEAIKTDTNRIEGHALVEDDLQTLTRKPFSEPTKAAGGIFSSIDDMAKWVETRLNYGKFGSTKKDSIFSRAQAEEMWQPQTIMETGKEEYNTHFKAYGLGWRLQDVNGYFQVWHTGALSGMVSKVMMIPELDLGVVVLTNHGVGAAYQSVINSILDGYFDIKNKDRITEYQKHNLDAQKHAQKIEQEVDKEIEHQLEESTAKLKNKILQGKYKDNWFGSVDIKEQADGVLRFESSKSPDLKGNMHFYKGTTYVVRWEDRTIKADAFVSFNLDEQGKAEGFTMKAISPLTDFSYDFQDLDFKRIKK